MRHVKIGIPVEQEEQTYLGNNNKKQHLKNEVKIKKMMIGVITLLLLLIALLVSIYILYAQQQDHLENYESTKIVPDNNILEKESIETEQEDDSEKDHQLEKSNLELPPQQPKQINNKNIQFNQSKSLVESYSEHLINNRDIYVFLKKRIAVFSNHLSPYRKMGSPAIDEQIKESKIAKKQFGMAIELMAYAPLILNNSQKVSDILKIENEHYESRYNISSYAEIEFCVIVPTYMNTKKFRYFMNLYTILQQQYDHYHVVIIDDASEDHTADKLEQQMRLNPSIKKRVTLVRNKKREYHMANIYNAVYDYCKAGQILVIVDGDDELIGKKVFKLFNAAYHRSNAFAIYSNHIQSKKDIALEIGISKAYPPEVIKENNFRQVKHYYSHLKTTWVDLFLQIKQQSLKTSEGKWYNNAVDNAIFLSIFEMACGRVLYLPEITYKYNTFTGNSVANMDYSFRKATADEIKSKKKYSCISDTRPDVYEKLISYIRS